MCLVVTKSHVKKPIQGLKCLKLLRWNGYAWATPYQRKRLVRDNGHFIPVDGFDRKAEFKISARIDGGFIHAYDLSAYGVVFKPNYSNTKILNSYKSGSRIGELALFKAEAYDVYAFGNYSDLVCKKLYIPAFDDRSKKECIWDLHP